MMMIYNEGCTILTLAFGNLVLSINIYSLKVRPFGSTDVRLAEGH